MGAPINHNRTGAQAFGTPFALIIFRGFFANLPREIDSDYDSGAGDLYSNAEISDEGYDSRGA